MKRPLVGFLTALTITALWLPGTAQPQSPAPTPVAPAASGTPTSSATPSLRKGGLPVVPGPPKDTAVPEASGTPGPARSASNGTGIYISDGDNGRVLCLQDMTANHMTSFGYPGHGSGRLINPNQVWVDSKGRIYIADTGNNRVVRVDDMIGHTWMEMDGFKAPQGVAALDDEVFVADTGNNRVCVYDTMSGNLTRTITDPRIQKPNSLWLDETAHLYISCGEDPPGGRVVKVANVTDTENSHWTIYEGQGLKPTGGFAPAQVVTSKESMWLVDVSSNRVVRVDNLDGRGAREWGGYGSTPGKYLRPEGLAIDRDGNIYVADTGNDRIVRLNGGDPTKLTVWAGEVHGIDTENRVSLRSPNSVFVWCPAVRPKPPEPDKKKKK